MNFMALGQRLNWGQLAAFVSRVPETETPRLLANLARKTPDDLPTLPLSSKADEEAATARLLAGQQVSLEKGWEIIPVENILAQASGLALECESLERAILAAGILERGADAIVVLPEAAAELKTIVAELKLSQGRMDLSRAVVTAIEPAGLGHRVCNCQRVSIALGANPGLLGSLGS